MSIYGGFVIEQQLLVGAVRDGHDVDVLKFGTRFTPITMRENVMPPDFATRFNLTTWRHRPVKKRVESRASSETPASLARGGHGVGRISSGPNSRFSASKTFHSKSPSWTTRTGFISAGVSALLPGSMVFRRTWPTPSAKIPFAGMIRKRSARTFFASNSQCCWRENP